MHKQQERQIAIGMEQIMRWVGQTHTDVMRIILQPVPPDIIRQIQRDIGAVRVFRLNQAIMRPQGMWKKRHVRRWGRGIPHPTVRAVRIQTATRHVPRNAHREPVRLV